MTETNHVFAYQHACAVGDPFHAMLGHCAEDECQDSVATCSADSTGQLWLMR